VLGLAAVLLFFVVSGTIAYLNLRTIRDDSEKVTRSHAVIVALDDLFEERAGRGDRAARLSADRQRKLSAAV
jgi:hypothetical protein